ncbi:hypothetical protein GM182_07505 [bacterium 3DAC]|nr:hypothetical protein GM182_07505 [bacterium 3DAC]
MNNIVNTLKKFRFHGAETINLAGALAWNKSDRELAHQLLMTGSFGNTYYATAEANLSLAMSTFHKVALEDPTWFAGALVEARNDGFMRTMPIIGLIILRKYAPDIFKEAFSMIIHTGGDLEDFLTFTRAMGMGFGRAVKSAIKEWIKHNTNEYYAVKYRRQIADAIRITHFEENNPIYDYVVAYRKHIPEEKLIAAYKQYPQISATELVKNLLKEKQYDKASDIIVRYRLDPATIIGSGVPDDPAIWQALMKVMGTGMLIGYLSKLIRTGAINENTLPWLKDRLTAKALYKAKTFPHRIITTALALKNPNHYNFYMYTQDTPDTGITTEVINILKAILPEIGKLMQNTSWNGRWIVAPDISGSMTAPIGSNIPSYIAGAMAGMIRSIVPSAKIVPWDTEVYEDMVTLKDTPFDVAEKIVTASGGGTFMEEPVRYMIHRKIRADYIVFITDSMEWGEGWLGYWIKYKKIFSNAKAILIRVDPYETNPFPEEAKKQHDIYQIYGWSPTVLKWIETYVLAA